MIVARWRVDARFGHKQQVVDALKVWGREFAPRIGLDENHGEVLSGSIGALEATVEHNWRVESLAALEQAWAKLGTIEAHKAWGEALEPHIVSGTSRWEVFRMV